MATCAKCGGKGIREMPLKLKPLRLRKGSAIYRRPGSTSMSACPDCNGTGSRANAGKGGGQ